MAEFKYISSKEKVSFLIAEMETNFKAPIQLEKKKHNGMTLIYSH